MSMEYNGRNLNQHPFKEDVFTAVVHLQIQEIALFLMTFFLAVFSLLTVFQYFIFINSGYLYVGCIYSNPKDGLKKYLLCFQTFQTVSLKCMELSTHSCACCDWCPDFELIVGWLF